MNGKKIKGVEYWIYDSLEEFIKYKHLGTDIKYWRDDDVKEGDYVRTDLGGITKCLKAKVLNVTKGRKGETERKLVTTICGTYAQYNMNTKMDNTVRERHCRFVSKDGTQKTRKDKKLTKEDKAMARLVMLGKKGFDAYKQIHPDAKSEVYIKQRVSTITNRKDFQNYMEKTFSELLSTALMTEEWSLENLKKLAEDKTVSGAVREKILTDNLKYHGRIKDIQQVDTFTQFASHKIGEGELAEIKKIGEKTKTEKKEIEVNE